MVTPLLATDLARTTSLYDELTVWLYCIVLYCCLSYLLGRNRAAQVASGLLQIELIPNNMLRGPPSGKGCYARLEDECLRAHGAPPPRRLPGCTPRGPGSAAVHLARLAVLLVGRTLVLQDCTMAKSKSRLSRGSVRRGART